MFSSPRIEKVKKIPRFKKPAKSWKEQAKIKRQHREDQNLKLFLAVIAQEQNELEEIEEKERQEIYRDLELMYR